MDVRGHVSLTVPREYDDKKGTSAALLERMIHETYGQFNTVVRCAVNLTIFVLSKSDNRSSSQLMKATKVTREAKKTHRMSPRGRSLGPALGTMFAAVEVPPSATTPEK
jgi:hypothetical protein